MHDTPLLLCALAIWTYWLSVLVMSVRKRLSSQKISGLVPVDPRERLLWLVWIPVIAGWIALPALASRNAQLLEVPAWIGDVFALRVVRLTAAILAWACYLLTVVCWIVMGRNWSVAVVADDQQLVTRGPFRLARHPIYALSILLILCTVIVLPTIPMAVVALLHVILLHLKARGEERHLTEKYGDQYRDYMRGTGRFMPKIVAGR